jgi:hypothetical protein
VVLASFNQRQFQRVYVEWPVIHTGRETLDGRGLPEAVAPEVCLGSEESEK